MRRWLKSMRFHFAMNAMMRERHALWNRPWEQDLLHWSADGHLHGTLVPPDDGKLYSVTSDGWCPCWARQQLATEGTAQPTA